MPLDINFARKPFKDYRAVYGAVSALALVGLVLLLVNLRSYTQFRTDLAATRAEIKDLQARLATAETEARQLRESLPTEGLAVVAERSRGINQIVEERRFSWSDLLDRLERVLPEDVHLLTLAPSLDEGGVVRLQMSLVGRNAESSVRTLAAFSRDADFSDPSIDSESVPEGTAEGYRFAMTVTFASGRTR